MDSYISARGDFFFFPHLPFRNQFTTISALLDCFLSQAFYKYTLTATAKNIFIIIIIIIFFNRPHSSRTSIGEINRSFCIKRIRPTKKINPNRKWEKMVEVFLWPLSSLFLRQSRVVISPWPERQSVLSGCFFFFTTGHPTSRFSACLQSKLKEYEPGDQSTNKMQMNNQGGRFWWGKQELHPNLCRKFLLRTELFFCFERHLPNKTTTAYDLSVLVCFAGFWIY